MKKLSGQPRFGGRRKGESDGPYVRRVACSGSQKLLSSGQPMADHHGLRGQDLRKSQQRPETRIMLKGPGNNKIQVRGSLKATSRSLARHTGTNQGLNQPIPNPSDLFLRTAVLRRMPCCFLLEPLWHLAHAFPYGPNNDCNPWARLRELRWLRPTCWPGPDGQWFVGWPTCFIPPCLDHRLELIRVDVAAVVDEAKKNWEAATPKPHTSLNKRREQHEWREKTE